MPPEQILLVSPLQAFYGLHPEQLLLEKLHYKLLFRWFVGLRPDGSLIWHPPIVPTTGNGSSTRT